MTAAAAGVRPEGADAEDRYYQGSREDLRALVPDRARRVLDVGCGAGALGAALRAERGIEVAGIEFFADAAEIAARRLDHLVVANLDEVDELPFDEGSFDAMTFGDVLEHLRDPHRLLRVLRRYLAPGGVIACSIPNVKHWSVVVPLLVGDRWAYTDSGLLDRTHVHLFTLEEIGVMLDETGYEAIDVRPVHVPGPPPVAALARYAAGLGADALEVEARLNAYQYLVAARPLA
jgi:2-polyprenyl-3-methyl-5-hydroxy-6-metoxy-1,4-benzoquinol methylase